MIDYLQPLMAMGGSGGDAQGQFWFVPFILIFLIFYFIMIAPARKKEKARDEMIRSLKAGDRVVTTGGIHGTVVGLTDTLVQIRIADKVKIDVARQAVAGLQGSEESGK